MTVYIVNCSGGDYDYYWTAIEGCFQSYELAKEYIEKRENVIKSMQENVDDFYDMFYEFIEEISKDGRPYFNAYGDSADEVVNKMETYTERNEKIGNFFKKFDKNHIKQMYVFFVKSNMFEGTRSCNIKFSITPLHVITSLNEISEKIN